MKKAILIFIFGLSAVAEASSANFCNLIHGYNDNVQMQQYCISGRTVAVLKMGNYADSPATSVNLNLPCKCVKNTQDNSFIGKFIK